jgi:hypothetical protein
MIERFTTPVRLGLLGALCISWLQSAQVPTPSPGGNRVTGASSVGLPTSGNPPPAPTLTVDLKAYRPQSEAYGSPLIRRSAPEATEETPGVGIRINGDDDNGNSVPDRDDLSVGGENDLIEVVWTVSEVPAPTGYEYVIRRSSNSIKVWSNATKNTAILDENNEGVISPSTLTGSIWVENTHGGSARLALEVRSIATGEVPAFDRLRFFPFTSILIGLHGEFQFPTDPPFGPNEGISVLAIRLQEQAYDSHMYVEDEVLPNGSGAVYDEIVSAVQRRGVIHVALYGFSHGGGSVHDLAKRLNDNKASIGEFDLPFTAYADAIENDSTVDLDSEVRLPPASAYHVNYYQWFGFIPPWGDFVPGADVNVNTTSTLWGLLLTHIFFMNSTNVMNGIYDPLVIRVPR